MNTFSLFFELAVSVMFRKKKRPVISMPTNFEHRVHTGFDRREGRYVGLPPQWASIIQVAPEDTNRPKPIIDPSNITPTEILDLKMHVSVLVSCQAERSNREVSVYVRMLRS